MGISADIAMFSDASVELEYPDKGAVTVAFLFKVFIFILRV